MESTCTRALRPTLSAPLTAATAGRPAGYAAVGVASVRSLGTLVPTTWYGLVGTGIGSDGSRPTAAMAPANATHAFGKQDDVIRRRDVRTFWERPV